MEVHRSSVSIQAAKKDVFYDSFYTSIKSLNKKKMRKWGNTTYCYIHHILIQTCIIHDQRHKTKKKIQWIFIRFFTSDLLGFSYQKKKNFSQEDTKPTPNDGSPAPQTPAGLLPKWPRGRWALQRNRHEGPLSLLWVFLAKRTPKNPKKGSKISSQTNK